jgi:hypothetical protein
MWDSKTQRKERTMDKPEEKQTEAAIVLAKPEEVQALVKTCQLHWKDVRYTIAAFNRKIGNAMGGERYETEHIFGRCLGERSDGKTFFATTVLPWIWDEHYEWKMIARSRLDSFLFPECKCDARTEETKVCDYHHVMICHWEDEDRRSMGLEEAKKMTPATEGGGVLPLSSVMHKDYPWCRAVKTASGEERYICTVCGFGKDERQAFANPTYRNIFIRDHSHCGFGDANRYAPKNPNMAAVDEGWQSQDFSMPGRMVAYEKPLPVIPKEVTDGIAEIRRMAENITGAAPQPCFHRAEHVCLNCRRGVYAGANGVLYHLDLMRACHWSGLTVAEA